MNYHVYQKVLKKIKRRITIWIVIYQKGLKNNNILTTLKLKIMKKILFTFSLLLFLTAINAQIVINEINYKDAIDFETKDWIELYNNGSTAVDISNWVFKDSDDLNEFVIPAGTIMQPDSYLVLSQFLVNFQQFFPNVTPVLGDFTFGLFGGGELIRLFNNTNELVDMVTYDDVAPWPVTPDGNGPTLELKNANFDNDVAENWDGSVAPDGLHGTPGAQNSAFTLGINQLELTAVSIYPNPLVNQSKIELPNNINNAYLFVYNALGKKIKRFNAVENNIIIEKENLISGIYIIELHAEDGTVLNIEKLLIR
jgi:hypothetical protein